MSALRFVVAVLYFPAALLACTLPIWAVLGLRAFDLWYAGLAAAGVLALGLFATWDHVVKPWALRR